MVIVDVHVPNHSVLSSGHRKTSSDFKQDSSLFEGGLIASEARLVARLTNSLRVVVRISGAGSGLLSTKAVSSRTRPAACRSFECYGCRNLQSCRCSLQVALPRSWQGPCGSDVFQFWAVFLGLPACSCTFPVLFHGLCCLFVRPQTSLHQQPVQVMCHGHTSCVIRNSLFEVGSLTTETSDD